MSSLKHFCSLYCRIQFNIADQTCIKDHLLFSVHFSFLAHNFPTKNKACIFPVLPGNVTEEADNKVHSGGLSNDTENEAKDLAKPKV